MARYIPMEMVKFYRGKICSHSDVYFAKKGKTLFTGKRCNPRNLALKPYSAEELATHTKFAATITAIKALTAEQIAAYTEAFADQKKYATLNGYIFAQEYAKIV